MLEHDDDGFTARLCAIIEHKKCIIKQLRQTINDERWKWVYDGRYPLRCNANAYHWFQHWTCRHFLNGRCAHGDARCPRLHFYVSPDVLVHEVNRLSSTRDLACSKIFNEMFIISASEQRASHDRLYWCLQTVAQV